MWIRFWGLIFLLGGILLGAVAVNSVAEQDRAIRTFIPTPALVDSTAIDIHHGKNTSYSPRVHYHYTVNGENHSADQIFPVDSDGGSAWANGIIDQFPEHQPTTAYVDPFNPDNAILIREYTSPPYWGALATDVLAFLGLMMLLGFTRAAPTDMRALPLGDSGFHLLLPRKNLRRRKWESFAWTAGILFPALLLNAHYASRAWPFSAGGWFLLIVTTGAAVFFAAWVFRRWANARSLSDARVQVSPIPLVRGQPLLLQVEWDALRDLRVEALTAQLLCIEHYTEKRGNKTYSGTRTRSQHSVAMPPPAQVTRGTIIQGSGELPVDPAAPATSARPAKPRGSFSYFTWEIRLHAQLAAAVDYRESFVVQVV